MLNCCEAPATIAFISVRVDLTLLRVDLILFIVKFILNELASTVFLAKGMVNLRRQIPNRIIFFIFDLSPNCSSLSPVDLLISSITL